MCATPSWLPKVKGMPSPRFLLHASDWTPRNNGTALALDHLLWLCVRETAIFFFLFNEILLIDNVVLISAVQQSDSFIHIYTSFLIFFSIMVYHRILSRVPVLYSKALLFIHPIYNSLHLLTPNSQSTPPHPPSSLASTSRFSMSVSRESVSLP